MHEDKTIDLPGIYFGPFPFFSVFTYRRLNLIPLSLLCCRDFVLVELEVVWKCQVGLVAVQLALLPIVW